MIRKSFCSQKSDKVITLPLSVKNWSALKKIEKSFFEKSNKHEKKNSKIHW